MPKHPDLKRQRGSVLVGVIALSLAMTVAAAGYIVAAGASAGEYQTSIDARKMRVAAESAAQMAMRAMRDVVPSDYMTVWGMPNNTTRAISTGWPSFTTLQNASVASAMGNPRIRAWLSKNSAGNVFVFADATYTGKTDTVRISWQILNAVCCGNWGMYNLTLKNWKDTILVRH